MSWQCEGSSLIPTSVGVEESYRFQVSVIDQKLVIWLEDRTTKQQWRTKDLSVVEYVPSDMAIPRATDRDYAERFAECLQADKEHAGDCFFRSITAVDKDGSRVLALEITGAFSAFHVRLKYLFTMLPVALEKADLLAAQVRDLQDELAALKATMVTKDELAQLRNASPSTFQSNSSDY